MYKLCTYLFVSFSLFAAQRALTQSSLSIVFVFFDQIDAHNHLDAQLCNYFPCFPLHCDSNSIFGSVNIYDISPQSHYYPLSLSHTEFKARIIYINLLFVVCQHTD